MLDISKRSIGHKRPFMALRLRLCACDAPTANGQQQQQAGSMYHPLTPLWKDPDHMMTFLYQQLYVKCLEQLLHATWNLAAA
eukprot:gene10059-10214_t